MTLKEKYTSEFEELDKLIMSVDKDYLQSLIDKHENTNIKGPTFREYFNNLDDELCYEILAENIIQYQCYSEKLIEPYYIISETSNLYYPPPSVSTTNKKKDSANSQSLFFCLYLHYGRSRKSSI